MIKDIVRTKNLCKHLGIKKRQKLLLLRSMQDIDIAFRDTMFSVIDNKKVTPDVIFN